MNNPPAFPQPIRKHQFNTTPQDFQVMQCGGMTLRDYFAAKAMQSVVTLVGLKNISTTSIASDSYDIADAMLKARENV